MEHRIKWDDEKVKRLWNYYSKTWPYSEDYFADKFAEKILSETGVDLNQKVKCLDFGSGPGFLIKALQQRKAKWIYNGVDFSESSVEKARIAGELYEGFSSVSHINSLPINFPEKTFDIIFLIEVIEHLTDDQINESLIEIKRLLKPSGLVVITTPNDENLMRDSVYCPDCGSIFHKWQHMKSWTQQSLSKVLVEKGFNIEHSKELDFNQVGFGLREFYYKFKNMYKKSRGRFSYPHLMVVGKS